MAELLLTALKSLYCVWLFYFSEKAKQKGMKQTVTQENSSSHQALWIRKSKLSKGPQYSPGFLRHKMQSIKSKGRIGTERSSAEQTWNQCTTATCTDRHTPTSPCTCKELGNTALCDPRRSRCFSIKFLGNPHQGGSIRSHLINALSLWEAREKPRWNKVPLAGLAGRIPHGSPSTSSLMWQTWTVKWGAMGWAGEMFTLCCSATHTPWESSLSASIVSSPGQNTLNSPFLQEHSCLDQHGHGRATYAPLYKKDFQNQLYPRWDRDV